MQWRPTYYARARDRSRLAKVLDCIASGCTFLSMTDLPIDVLLTAPQKGWSAPACAGLVMLGPRGVRRSLHFSERRQRNTAPS